MRVTTNIQWARYSMKQLLFDLPRFCVNDPRDESILLHPLIEMPLTSIGQRNPFASAHPPQWKFAFFFKQHAKGTTEGRPLGVAAVMVPNPFEERRAIIRLILFVGRDTDVEQSVVPEFQASVSGHERRDLVKIPGIKTEGMWNWERPLKNFGP